MAAIATGPVRTGSAVMCPLMGPIGPVPMAQIDNKLASEINDRGRVATSSSDHPVAMAAARDDASTICSAASLPRCLREAIAVRGRAGR